MCTRTGPSTENSHRELGLHSFQPTVRPCRPTCPRPMQTPHHLRRSLRSAERTCLLPQAQVPRSLHWWHLAPQSQRWMNHAHALRVPQPGAHWQYPTN